MDDLSVAVVMEDTSALVQFIDTQPAASKGPMGCVGYCMSGQYAIGAAAYFPERILAAASIYGTHLVTEFQDSPHRLAQQVTARLYIGFAEEDIHVPAQVIDQIGQALRERNVDAEVEIFPGTHHGFAFPLRHTYHKIAAEQHWERLQSLCRRSLA